MINENNFKFIKQSQEKIYQNLIAIFEDCIAADRSIVLNWYDERLDYNEVVADVIQINAMRRYFVIRYDLHSKKCYKVIPFKLIDIDSLETTDTYGKNILNPEELKLDLLVNFHEIKG